jgi:hypothetical protein
MAVKLQLERHSRTYIDLLDSGNPLVTSDWSYLRWFCRYHQYHPRFLRFSSQMTNGHKTTVRTPFRDIYRPIRLWESIGYLRLAIPSLVLPLSPKLPLISAFSYQMTNGHKTIVRTPFWEVYRPIRRWESNGNPRLAMHWLVLPLWPKSPRFPCLFNRMTNGRKTTIRMPFWKVYRPIRCCESNGIILFAISLLVQLI